MKIKIIMAILFVSFVLAACNETSSNEGSTPIENKTTDIKELVLDYSAGNLKAKNASITSQQLIVTDSNGKELVYDLPEEDFFVSIAPYVNETHP